MFVQMHERDAVLIEMNIRWLRQALSLLDRLDAASYSTTPPGFAPHRAAAHLRHIIEFYRCFLGGLAGGWIDYDARRRDESIERSRHAASAAIREIIDWLKKVPAGRQRVWVRMEDAESLAVRDAFMQSSVSRELQVLSSHTIHHFALIAMTLRAHGVAVDPDFGMAPSTLRYLAWNAAEAA